MRNLILFIATLVAAPFLGSCSEKSSETGLDDVTDSGFLLTPAEGGQGTSMRVELEASSSAFVFGETSLDLGEGITVDELSVDDGWSLWAEISIDSDAELGLRDASLSIEGRDSVLTDAFRVRADSLEIDPETGKMGETLEVQLVGRNTEWLSGRTWVHFGDDIEIIEFTVLSETIAEATIAISPSASPGWRASLELYLLGSSL